MDDVKEELGDLLAWIFCLSNIFGISVCDELKETINKEIRRQIKTYGKLKYSTEEVKWVYILGAIPDISRHTRFISSDKEIKLYKEMKIPKASLYFNAGILLINLDKWRKNFIQEKIEKYLKCNAVHINFHDQDGLNAILWNEWYRLPYEWNVISDLFQDSQWCKMTLGLQTFKRMAESPKIIHFTGRHKPWLSGVAHPFKNEYDCYLKKIQVLGDSELGNTKLNS